MLAFGVPDETHYAFPFMTFFRKHATLIAGAATDRAQALAIARDYLREHRSLLAPYITTWSACTTRRPRSRRALAPDGWAAEGRPGGMTMAERFTATLGERHVVVPVDAEGALGEARPPVAGTVNGVPFRSRLMVYGGQTCSA